MGWPKRVCELAAEASIRRIRQTGAISVVCRDDAGLYMGSSALVLHGLMDPTILEALACREALALAKDLMLHQLRIVLDCKTVVTDIHSGMMGPIAPIVHEIIATSSDFVSCTSVFEGRLSNMEAHRLAKHALYLGEGRHLWLLNPHDPSVIPVLRSFD